MAKSYQLWFREKYNLAPTDERYLNATSEQIEAEYWAYYYQNNKVTDEIEDVDFDLDAEVAAIEREAEEMERQRLAEINNINDWEEVNLDGH